MTDRMTLAKIAELEALAKAADTDDLTAAAALAQRRLARSLDPATVLALLSSARRLLEAEQATRYLRDRRLAGHTVDIDYAIGWAKECGWSGLESEEE